METGKLMEAIETGIKIRDRLNDFNEKEALKVLINLAEDKVYGDSFKQAIEEARK